MAQRKQLTWAELRVGVFVLFGLIILMVAIFYVTGASFLGPKYKLITYLPEVDGLNTGAPVALDGVEIGNVQSIALTPHPTTRDQSITLVLRIDSKYKDQIRTDPSDPARSSTASLVTQGLLGDRYVSISRGLSGQEIPPGGVVPGTEEAAMKEMVERGADLMENLGALSTDIRAIVDQVHKGQGTIGKLITDQGLYDHLNNTVAKLDTVTSNIQNGQGTLGKLVASDELYTKVNATVGNLNDVVGAVKDQKGTIGKLVYDPSAYDNIKGLAANGNALLTDVRAGKGSLGKLATDDTLYANLKDATANVRDATAKLNSNQGTVGKMFTDPQLYDNMTGLTGDLRALISDFRADPKKFLHIKVGLF
jgi:phospholipid/cholesterol/gamma-HCH transport system substrate-binding protein